MLSFDSILERLPGFDPISRFNRNWSWLSYRLRSNTTKSLGYWVFIVPPAASLVSFLKTNEQDIFGTSTLKDLSVPFSWQVFFFGALCLLVANVLYSIYCPKFIEDLGEESSFANKVHHPTQISQYLAYFYSQNPKEDRRFGKQVMRKFGKGIDPKRVDVEEQYLTAGHLLQIEYDEEKLAEFYLETRRYFNERRRFVRDAIFVFYSLGFALFAFVVGENILFTLLLFFNW